jgi:hypothetical protein
MINDYKPLTTVPLILTKDLPGLSGALRVARNIRRQFIKL